MWFPNPAWGFFVHVTELASGRRCPAFISYGCSWNQRPQLCFRETRPGSLLLRIHARGALGLGGAGHRGASGFCDFEPAAFLNLYRIAHSESTVDKWNNSTPFHPVARVNLGMSTGCWSILSRLGRAATPLRSMLSSTGAASIVELIAAICLVVAVAGFAKWRAASWLVCGAVAALALIVAALVVIGQS
jgi:hypothetical protein